jgi:hypothetical protein
MLSTWHESLHIIIAGRALKSAGFFREGWLFGYKVTTGRMTKARTLTFFALPIFAPLIILALLQVFFIHAGVSTTYGIIVGTIAYATVLGHDIKNLNKQLCKTFTNGNVGR